MRSASFVGFEHSGRLQGKNVPGDAGCSSWAVSSSKVEIRPRRRNGFPPRLTIRRSDVLSWE